MGIPILTQNYIEEGKIIVFDDVTKNYNPYILNTDKHDKDTF